MSKFQTEVRFGVAFESSTFAAGSFMEETLIVARRTGGALSDEVVMVKGANSAQRARTKLHSMGAKELADALERGQGNQMFAGVIQLLRSVRGVYA